METETIVNPNGSGLRHLAGKESLPALEPQAGFCVPTYSSQGLSSSPRGLHSPEFPGSWEFLICSSSLGISSSFLWTTSEAFQSLLQ